MSNILLLMITLSYTRTRDHLSKILEQTEKNNEPIVVTLSD